MKTQASGNIPNLIAAFYAVLSIPTKNFKMDLAGNQGCGQPFEIDAKGRCNNVMTPLGWVAQHPVLKKQGLKLEAVKLPGRKKAEYMPVLEIKVPGYKGPEKLRGLFAVARVLDVDTDVVHKIFSPARYDIPAKVTNADVAKRIKAAINRAGGKVELAIKEKTLNAHKKAAEGAKTKSPKK